MDGPLHSRSGDPRDGRAYLLCQAAVFPLTGAGLACYFACLGIGLVGKPFALAAMRLLLIVTGAWLALALTGSAVLAFIAVAMGIALFAVGLLAVTRIWFSPPGPLDDSLRRPTRS